MTDEATSCEEGAVRLDPTYGLVELCKDRTWGRVCDEKWDINDARVVCSQLQFDPKGFLKMKR